MDTDTIGIILLLIALFAAARLAVARWPALISDPAKRPRHDPGNAAGAPAPRMGRRNLS